MATASASIGAAASSSAGASRPRAKKSAKSDLLRDYYGIGGADDAVRAGGASSTGPSTKGDETMTNDDYRHDPLDPDSGAAFDTEAAFRHLLQTKSLAQLLRQESDLLTEIRELDGERQSLVYNHHHELVSASETMKSMKERADALMPGLGSLQSSMQGIAETSRALQQSAPPRETADDADEAANNAVAKAAPVIALPQRMRDIVALEGPAAGVPKVQSLWGSMEAVLSAWDEAGVAGARDIMAECRHVLREAQQQTAV